MKKSRQVRPGLPCLVISLEAEDLGFQNENHRHTSSLALSHFVLFCFVLFCGCLAAQSGEDNGTPLQYSCLESPMDGGAW